MQISFNFNNPREAQLAIALISALQHSLTFSTEDESGMFVEDDDSLEILPNAIALIHDMLINLKDEHLREMPWDELGWAMIERCFDILKPSER